MSDTECTSVGKEQVMELLPLLSKAVLSGACMPMPSPDEGVLALAKRHLVASCLFAEDRNAAIKRQILFDAEREEIFQRAKARNIPVLELKGNALSKLYPAYGMRSFADADLLIPTSFERAFHTLMKEAGYSLRSKSEVHANYCKDPCFHFEIHTRLFPKTMKEFSYFEGIWERVSEEDGKYRMGNEDSYLYFLAHAYKHSVSGFGLRTYLDFLLLKRKLIQDGADFSAIEKELAHMGLSSFAEKLAETSEILFYGTPDQELLQTIAKGSVYGTLEENTVHRMEQDERFLRHALFPSRGSLASSYPILYRFPVLYPVFWLFRLFAMLFCKSRRDSALFRFRVYRRRKKNK